MSLDLVESAFTASALDRVWSQYLLYSSRGDLWFRARDRWSSDLLEGFASDHIEIVDLGSQFSKWLVRESVHRTISRLRFGLSGSVRYSAQFCRFYPGTGINTHRDSHYLWAATIYLNSQWDRLQGGYFCSQDLIHVPCYNSMVVVSQGQAHSVSEVYGLEPRITLQIWACS